MKRVRRISISIERREIFASMTQHSMVVENSGATLRDHAQPPTSCPACNGTSFLSVQDDFRQESADADRLRCLFLNNNLHVQRLPDGGIWICRRSWEQLVGGLP
jgi:hypothetical protein